MGELSRELDLRETACPSINHLANAIRLHRGTVCVHTNEQLVRPVFTDIYYIVLEEEEEEAEEEEECNFL